MPPQPQANGTYNGIHVIEPNGSFDPNTSSVDIVAICVKTSGDDENGLPAFTYTRKLPATNHGPDGPSELSRDRVARAQADKSNEAVAVHKTGPPTSPSSKRLEINWLVHPTMLPSALRGARVIGILVDLRPGGRDEEFNSFEISSKIAEELAKRRESSPKQPVMFIGHGYGSVIVRDLLSSQLEREELIQSTAGAVFFAPPLEIPPDSLIRWTSDTLGYSKNSPIFRTGLDPRKWNDLRGKTFWTFAIRERQADDHKDRDLTGHIKQEDIFDFLINSESGVDKVAKFLGRNDVRYQRISQFIAGAVTSHQILFGDGEKADEAIKQSHKLNFEGEKGRSILHMAAEHDCLDRVCKLLKSGKVDVDCQNASGQTPLHISTASKSPHGVGIAQELLRAGASQARQDNSGISPKALVERNWEADSAMSKLFRRPPLVEGQPQPETLEKGAPPSEEAEKACRESVVVVRNIYAPNGSQFDTHLPLYTNVFDILYSEPAQSIENLFGDMNLPETPLTCRWYHIPMNNMAWIHDLFAQLDLKMWPWPARHRRIKVPHGRCMNPQAAQLQGLKYTPKLKGGEKGWVMLMPYISYESFERQQKHCSLIKSTVSTANEDCAEPDLQYEPDEQVIRAYLNVNDSPRTGDYELALHPRRTLDQSYYYMIQDTTYRDKTQVVSRHWKYARQHNVLMVDQLWLWFIKGTGSKPDTVITSFPSRRGASSESRTSDDVQASILHTRQQRKTIFESKDLISRILAVCCRAFDRHQGVESLQFLQAFESEIGETEEELTRLFRRFRSRAKLLHVLHQEHKDYANHRNRILNQLLDIQKESRLLKEVKDILDEIKMIRSIVEDQITVMETDCLRELSYSASERASQTRERSPKSQPQRQAPFPEVEHLLKDARRNFASMENHARGVEKGLEHLLDLKQKQANLWEARSSREGAESASKQESTILVFTVVTILFLPLSFMASFFALGVDVFPKEDGQDNWPLSYMSGLLFGISFAVSIPFILIAFYVERFTTKWTQCKRALTKRTTFWILKPLRGGNSIKSRRIRAAGNKWFKRLVSSIMSQDLPMALGKRQEKLITSTLDDPATSDEDLDFHHPALSEPSSGDEDTDDDEMGLYKYQSRQALSLGKRVFDLNNKKDPRYTEKKQMLDKLEAGARGEREI